MANGTAEAKGGELEEKGAGGKEVAPRGFPLVGETGRTRRAVFCRRDPCCGVEPCLVVGGALDGRDTLDDDALDAIYAAWPADKPLPEDARAELGTLMIEVAEKALTATLQGNPWTRDELKAHAKKACATAVARHLERVANPMMIANAPAFEPVREAFKAIGITATLREEPATFFRGDRPPPEFLPGDFSNIVGQPLSIDDFRKAVADIQAKAGTPLEIRPRPRDPMPPDYPSTRLATLERIVSVYGTNELEAHELDELTALRLEAKARRSDPVSHSVSETIKAQVLRHANEIADGSLELVAGEIVAHVTGHGDYRISINVERVSP